MRKLNSQDIKRYGSAEQFALLQDSYLDGLEAAGGSPRTLQDRLSSMDSNKPLTTNRALDVALGDFASDVRAIAFAWSKNPYFMGDPSYTYEDLCLWAATYWISAQESEDNVSEATVRTYCSTSVNNAFKDKLKSIMVRQPRPFMTAGYNEALAQMDGKTYRDGVYEEKAQHIFSILEDSMGTHCARVICSKYGIGCDPMSHEEIAEEMGITVNQSDNVIRALKSNAELSEKVKQAITSKEDYDE